MIITLWMIRIIANMTIPPPQIFSLPRWGRRCCPARAAPAGKSILKKRRRWEVPIGNQHHHHDYFKHYSVTHQYYNHWLSENLHFCTISRRKPLGLYKTIPDRRKGHQHKTLIIIFFTSQWPLSNNDYLFTWQWSLSHDNYLFYMTMAIITW